MATYEELQQEHRALQAELQQPGIASNPKELQRISRRLKQIDPILAAMEHLRSAEREAAELTEAISSDDAELVEMAKRDLPVQEKQLASVQAELSELQQPRDQRDDKNVILEIRAGAGGDESSLFARELFEMYQRFSESRGWRVELLSSSPSEVGGYKELVASVGGEGAFGALKYEAGTHRVQRIPQTESGGRIHTSTVTVAVLPEAEERDVQINPEEIRIDVYRSSGPGGQSVNTTDSAVRITHLPTGITVSVQDEKSQHKNRAKAMTILRARLQAAGDEADAAERGDARRSQIGTGDRSEKIRTYNFPQDRLTDHRIGFSSHGLDKLLAGNLDPLISALQKADQERDG